MSVTSNETRNGNHGKVGGVAGKNAGDRKRIINCSVTDPNKILPIKYKWAREYYKVGVANNWVPDEVNMQKDVEMWRDTSALSEGERRMIIYNLGFFSTAESLTANNIVLSIYRHITNPECRQYLLRQAFEEAIHTDTFIYCCDTLGLDPDEVYNMYINNETIREKDDFVVRLTKNVLDPVFTTDTEDRIRSFVHDLVGFYVIMEGIFFYAGFAMILSLLRQNKMTGLGEQFQFILRDESVHLAFGIDLINTIVDENPGIWTDEFKTLLVDNIKKAVELEMTYTRDCLPEGILGLNSGLVGEYVRYIADRRLERIRLGRVYDAKNPFPWMSEIIDLRKEKNFFETRVTEYRSGMLSWED